MPSMVVILDAMTVLILSGIGPILKLLWQFESLGNLNFILILGSNLRRTPSPKKRTDQEDVDFDYLFANFFQQYEQEWQINLSPGWPFGIR
jgi:hypothetical protein